MFEIKVKGLAELQKQLDTLPARIERNVLRGGLRAGMNVIKPEAQRNIRSVSGVLARGLRVGTSGRNGQAVAYLRARGKHGFLAKWLEFGTKAHFISNQQKTRRRPNRIPKLAMTIGDDFVRGIISHPGIAKGPHAFLRPALEAKAGAAVLAMAGYMRIRLATMHGIDTSEVSFELEE